MAKSVQAPVAASMFALPLRWAALIGCALLPAAALADTDPTVAAARTLAARDAGGDLELVRRDVVELAELARTHIGNKGLDTALKDFQSEPWVREANGLHLWGVTTKGVSWFDTGHPELIGIDVSNITDIEGRFWTQLAEASARSTGEKVFLLLFPHPKTARSAVGYHTCFMLEDDERILCAGAFEDARSR
ncbi:hypothetical protein [Stappia indica]|uniref:hypothetical protein n=1 Tax=Stappia indica TaxID=538381 RepID=UPI000829DE9E|nr:hypothetical protein [Stappia indica]